MSGAARGSEIIDNPEQEHGRVVVVWWCGCVLLRLASCVLGARERRRNAIKPSGSVLPSKVVLPVNAPMSHSPQSQRARAGFAFNHARDGGGGEDRVYDGEVGNAITKCRVIF